MMEKGDAENRGDKTELRSRPLRHNRGQGREGSDCGIGLDLLAYLRIVKRYLWGTMRNI